MKKFPETDSIAEPIVRIDPSLDKRYENVVLSPEKSKKANEDLLKSNFVAFIKNHNLSSSK